MENNLGTWQEKLISAYEGRSRCCVNCRHNKRIQKKTYIECHCDIDDHYIGYVDNFEHWCKHWAKDHKFDEEESE